MKPDPAQVQSQQQMQAAQLAEQQKKVDKLSAEVDEIKSRTTVNGSKAKHTDVQTQLAPFEMQIQAAQAGASHKQAHNQSQANEITAAAHQIDHHHKTMEHVHKKVANAILLKKAEQPAATGAA
jgi:hypothetical protein